MVQLEGVVGVPARVENRDAKGSETWADDRGEERYNDMSVPLRRRHLV